MLNRLSDVHDLFPREGGGGGLKVIYRVIICRVCIHDCSIGSLKSKTPVSNVSLTHNTDRYVKKDFEWIFSDETGTHMSLTHQTSDPVGDGCSTW